MWGYQYDPELLGVNSAEGVIPPVSSDLQGQKFYVSNRPSHRNGETGAFGQTSYETHSVAPQETLESSRVIGKGDSSPKDSSPTSSVVDQGREYPTRSTPAPLASCHSDLYRCLKRRLGCSLRRLHSKSGSWSVPESCLHITFLELKVVLLSLKRFQDIVQGQIVQVTTDNTNVVAYINKEGGMRSGSPCALLWRPLCWCNLRHIVRKARHIPDCLNVTKSDNSDEMVSSLGGVRPPVSNLAPSTGRRVCNKVQSQTDQVCVLSPKRLGVDALTVFWEDLDMYAFPTVSLLGKLISKLSDHQAQHAVVLGSSGSVIPDTHLFPRPSQSGDSTIQQGTSQGSDQSQSSRMAPRAEGIKEQVFSSPVAVQIEAPQRRSTRIVYEAKWSVVVKWCKTSQVDFRAPSSKPFSGEESSA